MNDYTKWEEMLDNTTITRQGGILNGDRPVQFSEDQKVFDLIKPQIKQFIKDLLQSQAKAYRGCVPEDKPYNSTANEFIGGIEIGWNECRKETLTAMDKLEE